MVNIYDYLTRFSPVSEQGKPEVKLRDSLEDNLPGASLGKKLLDS
jgi:hypothetical protein